MFATLLNLLPLSYSHFLVLCLCPFSGELKAINQTDICPA
jgi:hypothetical protein